MNTKTLEYIIAIAEEKSISRAAERFYLAQPVLSRHLKKTEEELGTPLFVREARHLTLTDAGILFINNAQAILHVQRRLEKNLEAMRNSRRDSLKLLVEPHYMGFLVKDILPKFRQQHPDFSIDIRPAEIREIEEKLASQEAELAVFTSRGLKSETLEYISLARDELLLVLPKNAYKKQPLRPDMPDITNCLFCLHSPGTAMRLMEDTWLSSLGISPHIVVESNLFRNTLEWIRHSQCCAFVPKGRIPDDVIHELITFQAAPPCIFHQVLAYPRSASFKRGSRDLIRIAAERFRSFASKSRDPQVWK